MQKVGFVTAANNGCLDVFWNSATRKVWIHERAPLKFEQFESAAQEAYPEPQWHCEDDGPIVDTVARCIGAPATRVTLTNLMIFDEAERHGKAADARLDTEIYDCEWSDFACEHQVLHMLGAGEPNVVTTYAAEMRSPENQSLFLRSIQRGIAVAEARIAVGEEEWEDEFDDMDSEFGMPCPHSDNLALCKFCN